MECKFTIIFLFPKKNSKNHENLLTLYFSIALTAVICSKKASISEHKTTVYP